MAAFYLWLFAFTAGLLIVSFILHPLFSGIDRAVHGAAGALDGVAGAHVAHLHLGVGHPGAHGAHGDLNRINSRTVLAFLAFFGGVGWLALDLGLPGIVAFLLAVAAGWLSAWLVWRLIVFVFAQSATSTISAHDPVGREGRVTVAIRPHSLGRVLLELHGESLSILAQSADERPILAGATVLIARSEGGGIYTVRIEE